MSQVKPRRPWRHTMNEFYKALKALGFKRTHRGRSEHDCHVYEKQHNEEIKLELQLWPNGHHRVTHWQPYTYKDMDGNVHIGSHMRTTPTDFQTVEEMKAAIEHESTRYYKEPKWKWPFWGLDDEFIQVYDQNNGLDWTGEELEERIRAFLTYHLPDREQSAASTFIKCALIRKLSIPRKVLN